MKTKIIKLSDVVKHPNFSLSPKDYLYEYRETIKVKESLYKEMQRLLDLGSDIDIYKEGLGKNETAHVFTAKFDNGFEADIKVCVSESGCYIDPVMFDEDGYQICVLDIEDFLLGDYEFIYDDEAYLVELIIE